MYKFSENLIRRFLLVAAVFALSGICQTTQAADGELDQTFGSGGKQIVQIAAGQRDFAKAVAIQLDGKIVVGGELGDFSLDTNRAVLLRLNPDGSLDQSFGVGGKVINSGQIHLPALAIQPDGKIVTAAATAVSGISTTFGLVRYNADGSLDQTFGSGGYALNGAGNATSVILQPDGKIVVIGFLPIFRNGSDYLLARFNADGSPDQTFGSGGRVTTSFTSGRNSGDKALWAALQSDGKIVVTGYATSIPVALIRYNPNGSVDTSFGLDGSVLTPNFGATGSRILIQPDGKIVIGGGGFVLGRYNANGTTDQSFGSNGRISGGFGSGNGYLYGLSQQSDGKLFAAGSVSYTGTGECVFALSRYTANGVLDLTFGNNGFVLTNITLGTLDEAFALTIQPDGKAVLAGYAAEPGGSYHDFALARYQNSAIAARSTQFDFDGDSKADISIFRSGTDEWWYLKSSNGGNGAFQFGCPSDKIVPGDYTGDGKTDVAVFRPSTGEWFILRSENGSYYSYPFGTNGDIPSVGDFDGDGKADSAIYRPSDTNWYIRRSSDGGTTIQQFGASGDIPAIADYDGDGKSDIAIYRPSLGQWWIQRSSNSSVVAFQFGASADKPVQGDYTGDGKADVAIFRPSTGEWFVLRSEDSSYYSFPFGTNGDVPAPGDYDGDGKTDATVFRPSTNTWYSQRTSAGTLIQDFGQNGDKPVPNAFVP